MVGIDIPRATQEVNYRPKAGTSPLGPLARLLLPQAPLCLASSEEIIASSQQKECLLRLCQWQCPPRQAGARAIM